MATIASLSRTSSAAASSASPDAVRHDDGRLTDARTPTAHASTHAVDGSDPIPGVGGYATGVVPSGSTTAVIEHDLGTQDVSVTVQDVSSHLITPVAVEAVDGSGSASDNHVRITFSTAPATGQYRYLILSGAPSVGPGPSAAPITLTDASTIATDASLGTHFRATLGGNRTLGNPTNLTDGQRLIWELIQDGTGGRTLTLDSAFELGTDITAVTLSTTAGARDFLGAVYNSAAAKLYVLAFTRGY